MAEITLAVVGLVDGCIKLVNTTVSTYRAYRDAENIMDEKIVALEALAIKLERQLEFLRKIAKIPDLLDRELTQSFLNLLQQLQGKLLRVTAHLHVPDSEDSSIRQYFRKLKFAFVKKSLDELMDDVHTWSERFDPTWYLIILHSDRIVDFAPLEVERSIQAGAANARCGEDPVASMLGLCRAIKDTKIATPGAKRQGPGLNLSAGELCGAKEALIPFSSAKIIDRSGSRSRLIIESIKNPSETGNMTSQLKQDVHNLAWKLQLVDPTTFGLLRCKGLLKHSDSGLLSAIDVVYRAPPVTNNTKPTSLRAILLQQIPVSASAVVQTAKQLVRSVCYVHACDFVHKNIRPDNILVFPTNASPLGASYLIGFSHFRSVNFQTSLAGDPAWHRNLYRHPQRQGTSVQEPYVMQHDIYSLGVCLLELGLWRSFVWFPNDGGMPVPSMSLGMILSDRDFETSSQVVPLTIKDRLVTMAAKELPPRLGDVYTAVVLACLTCLDPGNEAFENVRDEDGIIVGVRFVEKILTRVSEICI